MAELSPSAALNRFRPPPGFVAGQRAAADADTPPGVDLDRLRYGFRLGGIGFLIDPDTPCEIIDPLPVSEVPNTPDWLQGLINLRGNLVPVFDLIDVLGLDGGAGVPQLLIIGEGESAVAIRIDSLPEVPDLSRRLTRLPPLPDVLGEHVAGGYADEGLVWLEFQHENFFEALKGLMIR